MVIELSEVQFGLKSYAWFQNWTSVQCKFDLKSQVWFQTKIHPFWNCSSTGLGQFKYMMHYWAGVKLNWSIFWWEKVRVLETKVAKFASIPFIFHFSAIWLVTLNKPWNLIGCFVISVASSLAGKKMQFKVKKWCNSWSKLIVSYQKWKILKIQNYSMAS